MNDPQASSPHLGRAVEQCRRQAGFLDELLELYRRVDRQVHRHRIVCMGGGACCKFDLMDHRLYASTGELALLCRAAAPSQPTADRRCPYQLGPRCTARTYRPLGCRIFSCRQPFQNALSQLYEQSHRHIRMLHQKYCLPYAYVEAPAAMMQLFVNAKFMSVFP